MVFLFMNVLLGGNEGLVKVVKTRDTEANVKILVMVEYTTKLNNTY